MEVESTTIGIKDFNVIEKYDQLDGLLKRIPSDKRGYYFYELKNIFPAEYRDRSNSNQEYDAKFLQGKMSKLKSSFKKDLVQYYPWFIVQKRFTPQRAAYLLIQWLEYLEKINSPHLKSLSSKSELAFIKRALAIRARK